MSTQKTKPHKAKPSQSVSVATTPVQTPVLLISDLVEQVLEISCRVAIYAHAAEHLDDDEAPYARQAAAGAFPVALAEVRDDLQGIVDRLQALNSEVLA
jgi:hypothetical protein